MTFAFAGGAANSTSAASEATYLDSVVAAQRGGWWTWDMSVAGTEKTTLTADVGGPWNRFLSAQAFVIREDGPLGMAATAWLGADGKVGASARVGGLHTSAGLDPGLGASRERLPLSIDVPPGISTLLVIASSDRPGVDVVLSGPAQIQLHRTGDGHAPVFLDSEFEDGPFARLDGLAATAHAQFESRKTLDVGTQLFGWFAGINHKGELELSYSGPSGPGSGRWGYVFGGAQGLPVALDGDPGTYEFRIDRFVDVGDLGGGGVWLAVADVPEGLTGRQR